MKRLALVVLSLMLVMGLSAVAYAGPGSVVIKTDGDITAKFGAQVRFVPTYEKNWDFGIKEKSGNAAFLPHTMEFGTVSNGYIRSEDRLYFNFAKGDIWDVYFALEFDDAVQSRTSDRIRQTQGDESSFGVERLNASVKLPWIYSRFNAGWDVYAVDLDAGSLVYGDDDPGFNLTGGVANIDWKLGYHKKIEVNRRVTSADRVVANNITNTEYDNDRDVWSARVNYTLFKDTKFGLIYALNDQKVRGNTATNDPCGVPTCQNVNANFISPIFTASIAGFKIAAQYAHTWGSADQMLTPGPGVITDYDISSNAAFLDIAYDMTPMFGFRFIPHIGVLWTQGDDNPSDNKLEGYSSITSLHQFFPSFGGENTFLAGGNAVVGTTVYSFLPDQRGNQNAFLGTGGIGGTGRGDNPGLLLIGGGITVDPIKNWSYRTNAYYLRYNEDLCLTSPAGACAATLSGAPNLITERDIGVEWDNEVSWWLDKNMVIKGQFSFLFPLEGTKQITRALANNGSQPDDTAIRLAVEMLWNF